MPTIMKKSTSIGIFILPFENMLINVNIASIEDNVTINIYNATISFARYVDA
jgi:hypothetical protein